MMSQLLSELHHAVPEPARMLVSQLLNTHDLDERVAILGRLAETLEAQVSQLGRRPDALDLRAAVAVLVLWAEVTRSDRAAAASRQTR
jgi:hypothetical protein